MLLLFQTYFQSDVQLRFFSKTAFSKVGNHFLWVTRVTWEIAPTIDQYYGLNHLPSKFICGRLNYLYLRT